MSAILVEYATPKLLKNTTAERVLPGSTASTASPSLSLVVEDETQVREVAERFLRRAGYDVLTASDAESALASLSENGPVDLVLTDSAMPGMRGEDLATQIGDAQPGLAVILMSGYADPARPPSKAVTAFIQKPFTMRALLVEVRRALRGSGSDGGGDGDGDGGARTHHQSP